MMKKDADNSHQNSMENGDAVLQAVVVPRVGGAQAVGVRKRHLRAGGHSSCINNSIRV